MNQPDTLEELDRLLGSACADLSVAAGKASIVGHDSSRQFKRVLADALVRVRDARDIIHAQRPDLKPEFAQEAEADPTACAAYFAAVKAAHALLAEGQVAEAARTLNSFAASTRSTFFARCARAEAASHCGDS